MSPEVLFYIYVATLIFILTVGGIRYKDFDYRTKLLYLLMALTLLTEIASRVFYYLHWAKTIVYHIYCVVDFFIMTLYFLRTIHTKRYHLLLLLAAILIPLAEVLNSLYLQPPAHLNSNMLILESFCVIAMSLYALYTILLDDAIERVTRYPHFWFWVLFLMLYSGTFFFWAYIKVLTNGNMQHLMLAQYIQAAINIAVYLGIGLTFLYYPKTVINEQ